MRQNRPGTTVAPVLSAAKLFVGSKLFDDNFSFLKPEFGGVMNFALAKGQANS